MGLKAVANPSGSSVAVDLHTAGINAITLGLPSIRFVGDSITGQTENMSVGSTGSPNTSLTRNPRIVGWMHWLSGAAFNYVSTISPVDFARKGSNNGISGNTMSDIITRLPGILAASNEYYIFLHIGTNDLQLGDSGGGSFTSMSANMTTIIGLITTAGKIPILTTVLPRNNVDGGGGSDWGTAGGTTAAQKRFRMNQFNTWLVEYARENGYICIPWHVVLQDSTGVAKTGWTADGLHPNETGAYWLAREGLRCMSGLLPKSDRGQLNVLDTYDATYNPTGNPLNGALTGTGGTTSDAGGAGTITGTVPDNWRMTKNTSTTTSVVTSIVTRGDGQPGNGIQFVFTSLGTGSATETWRFEYFASASTSLTGFALNGDLLEYPFEIEVVAGHGGVFKGATSRMTGSNTVQTANTIAIDATLKQITDSGNGFVTAGFKAGNKIITSLFSNGGNNGTFTITTVAAGVIQLDTATAGLVTEAAGSNRTITMPFMVIVTGGATTAAWPDDDTGIIPVTSPVCQISINQNIQPRHDIYINGTIAGTATIRIFRPDLKKLSLTPALLSFAAPDA